MDRHENAWAQIDDIARKVQALHQGAIEILSSVPRPSALRRPSFALDNDALIRTANYAIERAAAESRKAALLEAAALICPFCEAKKPIGSYYSDVDEWRPDPDWNAARTTGLKWRPVTHGYDKHGSPRYCDAFAIHARIREIEEGERR